MAAPCSISWSPTTARVSAPGLAALAAALRPLGRVSVLAPERNWSASGHVKTLHKPLRVRKAQLADGQPALACTGAPRTPWLWPSRRPEPAGGPGGLGRQPSRQPGPRRHLFRHGHRGHGSLHLRHSGSGGIDRRRPEFGYGPAAAGGGRIARWILDHGLPPGVLLNVNVPTLATEAIHGLRLTRQGQRVYRDALVTRLDPRGRPSGSAARIQADEQEPGPTSRP